MRDPNRIDFFLEVIKGIWLTYPDLRFSQLVLNAIDDDDYYLEDIDTLKRFLSVYDIKEGDE